MFPKVSVIVEKASLLGLAKYLADGICSMPSLPDLMGWAEISREKHQVP